jgi:hypothetical protein
MPDFLVPWNIKKIKKHTTSNQKYFDIEEEFYIFSKVYITRRDSPFSARHLSANFDHKENKELFDYVTDVSLQATFVKEELADLVAKKSNPCILAESAFLFRDHDRLVPVVPPSRP